MELPGGGGVWLAPHRHHRGPQFLIDTTNTGWGLLSGHQRGPLLGHQRVLFHDHGHHSGTPAAHRAAPTPRVRDYANTHPTAKATDRLFAGDSVLRQHAIHGGATDAQSDCPRARRASRAAVRRSRPNSSSNSARLANTPATIRPVALDVSIPSRSERSTMSRSPNSRRALLCRCGTHRRVSESEDLRSPDDVRNVSVGGSPLRGSVKLIHAEHLELPGHHPGERMQNVDEPIFVGHDGQTF